MAPIKTAQTARVAVIVGGSCTVASLPNGDYSVSDSITFGTDNGVLLNAPGIPNNYVQSRPIRWNYRNEMAAVPLAQGENDRLAELVVINTDSTETLFMRHDGGRAMAGVVLDTGEPPPPQLNCNPPLTLALGPGGDVRILLK